MKKIREISLFSKIMIVIELLLGLSMTVVALMEHAGYMLMYTNVGMMGTALMVWLLMIWGVVILYRRIGNRTARIIVSMVAGLLVIIVGMAGMIYLAQVAALGLPSVFATINSPDGDSVIVLRRIDTGMESEEEYMKMLERMDARYDYLLANPTQTPEGMEEKPLRDVPAEERAGEDYPVAAFGYVYTAYPRVYGLFYDVNASSEGRIFRGYESKAEIKFLWSEDGTLNLYLENPEAGDSGEIVVKK